MQRAPPERPKGREYVHIRGSTCTCTADVMLTNRQRYNAELVASLMRNIQALNKSLAAAKKMAARRAKEIETRMLSGASSYSV